MYVVALATHLLLTKAAVRQATVVNVHHTLQSVDASLSLIWSLQLLVLVVKYFIVLKINNEMQRWLLQMDLKVRYQQRFLRFHPLFENKLLLNALCVIKKL